MIRFHVYSSPRIDISMFVCLLDQSIDSKAHTHTHARTHVVTIYYHLYIYARASVIRLGVRLTAHRSFYKKSASLARTKSQLLFEQWLLIGFLIACINSSNALHNVLYNWWCHIHATTRATNKFVIIEWWQWMNTYWYRVCWSHTQTMYTNGRHYSRKHITDTNYSPHSNTFTLRSDSNKIYHIERAYISITMRTLTK